MDTRVPDLSWLLAAKPTSWLGWSDLADPLLVGLMARSGFDAVLLDQQHGFHDTRSCIACIGEAALAGRPTLVRVKLGDVSEAARMCDAGAAGVVAPMINGAEDARAFAAQVKYPPLGQRSFGPGRAMQLRGVASGADYVASANASVSAIAMCETREALASLDEILAVPSIDGILVGPSDLSLALSGGTSLDPSSDGVRAAMRHVVQATRAAGKFACAFAGDVARARDLARDGYQLVSIAYDEALVENAFAEAVRLASAPEAM